MFVFVIIRSDNLTRSLAEYLTFGCLVNESSAADSLSAEHNKI